MKLQSIDTIVKEKCNQCTTHVCDFCVLTIQLDGHNIFITGKSKTIIRVSDIIESGSIK